MRYWHPMTPEVVSAVEDYAPDRLILLPLYPQFSTATSGSSIATFLDELVSRGVDIPTRAICCYPDDEGFITAIRDQIEASDAWQRSGQKARVLLSAHGLPERLIDAGDPYAHQVERTAAALRAAIGGTEDAVRVCYQSRLGPIKWLGPNVEDEIRRAGEDGAGVIVVPIAFVSEHVETLVELDIEMNELAEEAGVPFYSRVPTVSVNQTFIDALAAMVENALPEAGADAVAPPCPHAHNKCLKRVAPRLCSGMSGLQDVPVGSSIPR